MKYIQLRAFHAVARELSVSRAADALNVTQPAVTLHLQALEEQYGLTLFNRSKTGVTLTRDGEELYKLTQRMFADEAEIASYLGGMAALTRGHISLAADGPHVALDLVSEYRARYPGVEVSMTLGNAEETLDDVMNQRVDAGLLKILTALPLDKAMVLHANHANELDSTVRDACRALRNTGLTLLNQSVLLRGINDTTDVLMGLHERLFSLGVLPYYLHVMDRVEGAAHFEVSEDRAVRLMRELSRSSPGYLVPKLAREVPGEPAKTWIPW